MPLYIKKQRIYIDTTQILSLFVFATASLFLINYHTNFTQYYELIFQNHSYFFIASTFIFITLLSAPISVFIKNKLNNISETLFYNKNITNLQRFYSSLFLVFSISIIFTILAFTYFNFYTLTIHTLTKDIHEGNKLTGFLFFSFITTLTYFSLKFIQIELFIKILTQDILKIDPLKKYSVIDKENEINKQQTLTTFYVYCGEIVFLPTLLPLVFNDQSIASALNNFNKLHQKVLLHKKLSINEEDIIFTHNLNKKSSLIDLSILFKKTTLCEIENKRELMINAIKDEKLHSIFLKNIKQANKFLSLNNKNKINLHTIPNPLNSINLTIDELTVFNEPINSSNQTHIDLAKQHQEYLMEIIIRR